eukprot:TRINITY_DN15399_c0_g1_i1.p1 TRINITY_DN15399_c0_g1~~TRINITY_DN15399_c0_g1_i1.p1  ORF type:complete len:520 (+),score=68.35 TRINITY_DN15399_c0_g1_i1:42-1562(+)
MKPSFFLNKYIFFITASSFFFFIFCINTTDALTDTAIIQPHNIITVFKKFGYQENGTLYLHPNNNLEIKSPDDVKFYLCNINQWNNFVSKVQNRISNVCRSHFSPGCDLDGVEISNDNILSNYRISKTDYYYLALVTCNMPHTPIILNYTLLNPNSSLSLETMPLPRIYLTFTALWMSFLSLWLLEWISNFQGSNLSLHLLLTLVIIFKLLKVAANWMFWARCESIGICPSNSLILRDFLFSASEALFFVIMLLVSQGWKITKLKLSWPEIRYTVLTFSLLFSTLLFLSLTNEEYLLAILLILYCYLLPRILSNITDEIRALDGTMRLLDSIHFTVGEDADIRVLEHKLKIFRALKISVVIYIFLILVFSCFRILLSYHWRLLWLNSVNVEGLELVVVGLVCWTLHPRHSSLNLFDGALPLAQADVQQLEDVVSAERFDANHGSLAEFEEDQKMASESLIVMLPSQMTCANGLVHQERLSFAVPIRWAEKIAPKIGQQVRLTPPTL